MTGLFPGFPPRTLLESGQLPIGELAELALREGQSTSPLYRAHRWFARRLSTQFRGMLVALSLAPGDEERFWDVYRGDVGLKDAVVLDPFVGGGTSLVEASRCEARVIGYDIDPVAASITRFELAAASYDGILPTLRKVYAPVAEQIGGYHRTRVSGGEAEVLHHFWVEEASCPACDHAFELHPHFQLAYDKAKEVQWVFCRKCHAVEELPLDRHSFRCGCRTVTSIQQGPLADRKVVCPACGEGQDLADRGRRQKTPPRWRLFAQEYVERTNAGVTRKFKPARDADRARYEQASAALQGVVRRRFAPPGRTIPVQGRSDRRPLLHGFRRYRELFNDRQLLHLTLLGEAVAAVADPKAKRVLGLAYSEHLTTNCMYAGYAFGYRRISPLFSIHSFRHIARPVELNPWQVRIGRGTFPNVVAKLEKAIGFARQPSDLVPGDGRCKAARGVGPPDGQVGGDPAEVIAGGSSAAVVSGSSADLSAIPDRSVDLILTDPPYFDNLSYSELSDFYLAWHQALGIAEPPYEDGRRHAPISGNLAVRDRSETSISEYRTRLGAILQECRRVLKPAGVCVFTYHHRSPLAWLALGEALARSGLRCTSVVPLRGEGQGGLHSYEGTIKWDAVLVCRRRPGPQGAATRGVVVSPDAVTRAERMVGEFAARLATHPRVGFRSPDRLNLFRASVIAAATTDRIPDGVPLASALQKEPQL